MCDRSYTRETDRKIVRCVFGDLVNGYVPTEPVRPSEAGGVIWRLCRPEGLENPFPNSWMCQEHHEELLLMLLRGPITYDDTCFPSERGHYNRYVEKGKKNIKDYGRSFGG